MDNSYLLTGVEILQFTLGLSVPQAGQYYLTLLSLQRKMGGGGRVVNVMESKLLISMQGHGHLSNVLMWELICDPCFHLLLVIGSKCQPSFLKSGLGRANTSGTLPHIHLLPRVLHYGHYSQAVLVCL